MFNELLVVLLQATKAQNSYKIIYKVVTSTQEALVQNQKFYLNQTRSLRDEVLNQRKKAPTLDSKSLKYLLRDRSWDSVDISLDRSLDSSTEKQSRSSLRSARSQIDPFANLLEDSSSEITSEFDPFHGDARLINIFQEKISHIKSMKILARDCSALMTQYPNINHLVYQSILSGFLQKAEIMAHQKLAQAEKNTYLEGNEFALGVEQLQKCVKEALKHKVVTQQLVMDILCLQHYAQLMDMEMLTALYDKTMRNGIIFSPEIRAGLSFMGFLFTQTNMTCGGPKELLEMQYMFQKVRLSVMRYLVRTVTMPISDIRKALYYLSQSNLEEEQEMVRKLGESCLSKVNQNLMTVQDRIVLNNIHLMIKLNASYPAFYELYNASIEAYGIEQLLPIENIDTDLKVFKQMIRLYLCLKAKNSYSKHLTDVVREKIDLHLDAALDEYEFLIQEANQTTVDREDQQVYYKHKELMLDIMLELLVYDPGKYKGHRYVGMTLDVLVEFVNYGVGRSMLSGFNMKSVFALRNAIEKGNVEESRKVDQIIWQMFEQRQMQQFQTCDLVQAQRTIIKKYHGQKKSGILNYFRNLQALTMDLEKKYNQKPPIKSTGQ